MTTTELHAAAVAEVEALLALDPERQRLALLFVAGYAPTAIARAVERQRAAAPDYLAYRKCPTCKAPTGLPCRIGVTSSYETGGSVLSTPHNSRKRKAVRS